MGMAITASPGTDGGRQEPITAMLLTQVREDGALKRATAVGLENRERELRTCVTVEQVGQAQ